MKKVVAVVVTYNRLLLLKENVDALLNQSYKSLDIMIIDNASSDGTEEYIKGLKNKNIIYINTGKNLGGAGGFSFGVKEALKRKYDYAWLMDDDTIPYNDSLDKLVDGANVLKDKFSFLNSYVEWTDGNPCYMNEPRIKNSEWFKNSKYLKNNLLNVLSCTFVSVLVNLDIAEKAGIPIKEMFIYGDDHEYTERLNRYEKGYMAFESRVLHKMKVNSGFDIINVPAERISRYYYDARNRFYRAKKSGAREVIINILWYTYIKFKILFSSKDHRLKRIWVTIKGFYAGIFFNPKIEYVKRLSK